MEMMLYLLSYTELTLAEIAKAINVTSKTLYNWRQKIRKSPKLIDDYLEELRQQEKLDRRNRKVAVRQYKNGYE
jgi:transposase-like protein